MSAITPCLKCPSHDWCGKRGCIVWNEYSRALYFELSRRAKESNDQIDELERIFCSEPTPGAPSPIGTAEPEKSAEPAFTSTNSAIHKASG